MLGTGRVSELILLDGRPAASIDCIPALVPAPGQYLLAHQPGSSASLPEVLFLTAVTSHGFVCAGSAPAGWYPGVNLTLRGPLGHGFVLPHSASRIALVACDDDARRLLPLADLARQQDASVTLVCERTPDDIPLHIEVQPYSALLEALSWADYVAVDADRASLPAFGRALRSGAARPAVPTSQVLVRAPMPCGALAECGVCSVKLRRGSALACDAGPVFDLALLDLEGQ